MKNIFNHLKPKAGEEVKYNSIINKYSLGADSSILWYHSAGLDFRSLFLGSDRYNPELRAAGKPDLFIYTDMAESIIDNAKKGTLFKETKDFKDIKVLQFAELAFEDDIRNYLFSTMRDYRRTDILKNNTIFLFDLDLGNRKENVPLLYFVWENTAFLKAFVIQRDIKIKYFQKPREYGFGGGLDITQMYMLFYLGLMQTQYLYLERSRVENYGQYSDEVKKIITEDVDLNNGFFDKNNYIPDVERIGIAFHRYFQESDLHDSYEILKLTKGNEEMNDMTYDEKRSKIMHTLRIGY